MTENRIDNGKWAPWWVYVVVIAGVNVAKQQVLQDTPFIVNLVLTVALVVVLFLVITGVYRGLSASGHR